MSTLDEAMLKHMKFIVITEHRPFSFKDFETFEVDGKDYGMKHGTFRNKVSKYINQEIVEVVYNSHISFYTLKGQNFGTNSSVTDNHMGSSSVTSVTELVELVEELPLDNKSIHDIHMKFCVPDIWQIIASNPKYRRLVNSVSKDIKLEPLITDNLKLQTTIHHTDTVTVVVGCSYAPVVIENVFGVMRLSTALTRVEERLSRVVDECGEKLEGGYERIPIPDNVRWTVTLWHFGRDAKVEYSQKGFAITWGIGREALLRIYSKEMKDNRTILRLEKQESPNKNWAASSSRKNQWWLMKRVCLDYRTFLNYQAAK